MGYLVELYREDKEKVVKKLYEAKIAICEAMEALEYDEEYDERRGGRMSRRHHNGRYDY